MNHLYSYAKYCNELENTRKFRKLPIVNNVPNQKLIDFSSNDYLALSRQDLLLQAAIDAGKTYGAGSTGSRLLSGNNELFENFEKQIAYDKREKHS